MAMKINIITTGGTIDKEYFDKKSSYEVGDPQIADVLREANVVFEFEVTSLLRKDSLDMTDADRQLVRLAVADSPGSHFLITHGTDTMIETANALIGLPGKSIVLTGSLAPARFKNSDAVFNIGCAVAALQLAPPGVYVAMNGRIFDPRRVRKNVGQNRFEEV